MALRAAPEWPLAAPLSARRQGPICQRRSRRLAPADEETVMLAEMKEVVSSHIWQIGYDPDSEALTIRYIPSVSNPEGKVIEYIRVDAKTAEQVLSAPSVGQAVHQLIRGK